LTGGGRIESPDGKNRHGRRTGDLGKALAADLGAIAGLARRLEGGPSDCIVNDVRIDRLGLGDGVERHADELGGPQHRAACDWIAAGRQVNAIGGAGFGQGGIAVQRQAGAVAPRDRQQGSCERNLIDFG
jgi:hypothetical protein